VPSATSETPSARSRRIEKGSALRPARSTVPHSSRHQGQLEERELLAVHLIPRSTVRPHDPSCVIPYRRLSEDAHAREPFHIKGGCLREAKERYCADRDNTVDREHTAGTVGGDQDL